MMSTRLEQRLEHDKITQGEAKCSKDWSKEAMDSKFFESEIGHVDRMLVMPVTLRE